MSDFLRNFVRSRAFKYILGLLAAAATAYATQGCAGLLQGARKPSLDVLACQYAALEPYVGDAAAEIAHQIDGNQAFSPAQFLANIGLTPEDAVEIARAYLACVPGRQPDALPQGDPS